MKIKITSDSTCDLSPELVERYNIGIIPLTVIYGERYCKDGVDTTPDDIYTYVEESGRLPKTSAINIDDYITFFKGFVDEGFAVVHFCISSDFSSTFQNASLAAQSLENVYVVDSRNLSTGQGLLVLRAADLAREGRAPEEIVADCEATAPKVEASFVIDRLDYLYKGGRCSALAAFGGNLLRLKPCIEVVDGHMTPGKKYRGNIEHVISNYVADRLTGRSDIDPARIFITHTKCSDACVADVRQKVKDLFPDGKEILETTAGATVTTHCGPNTLGVLFIRK